MRGKKCLYGGGERGGVPTRSILRAEVGRGGSPGRFVFPKSPCFFLSSPCCHVGWRWGALINMCTRNCQAPASWSESSKRSVLLGTGMLCVELAHAADGYTTTVPKHTLSSIEIPESNGTNTTRVRQPNKGSTVTVIQPNPFH